MSGVLFAASHQPTARAVTEKVCITATIPPSHTASRGLPRPPTRYPASSDFPCPGAQAWSAPTAAATSSATGRAAPWSSRDVRSVVHDHADVPAPVAPATAVSASVRVGSFAVWSPPEPVSVTDSVRYAGSTSVSAVTVRSMRSTGRGQTRRSVSPVARSTRQARPSWRTAMWVLK